MLNNILILLFIAGIIAALYFYNRKLDMEQPSVDDMLDFNADDYDTGVVDIKRLVTDAAEVFSKKLRHSIAEDNLTKEESKRQYALQTQLRSSLSAAAYGSQKDKRYIINNIKQLIGSIEYGLETRDDLETIISTNIKKNRPLDQFEILMYLYKRQYKDLCFLKIVDDYGWKKAKYDKDGNETHVVDIYDLREAYVDVLGENGKGGKKEHCSLKNTNLSAEDMKEIVAQRVFEKYIGFGPVDMLYHSVVDEIDAGASGVAQGKYTIKTNIEDLEYSYSAIWVMISGVNVHLKCIGFDSQDELIRVCDNIYKYNPPEVLSKSNGRVKTEMVDGSRITVVRPDFSPNYAFFLRKFDATPSVHPNALIGVKKNGKGDKNAIIPIVLTKWVLTGLQNTIISGDMGSGKSTFLKSAYRYIPQNYNTRVYEDHTELNLEYTYPKRNIVAMQSTANITIQQALDFGKTTNGGVAILGEIKTAEEATYFMQTSQVASRVTMSTHHATTPENLANALADNLIQARMYQDKPSAMKMVADVVNVNIGMQLTKRARHLMHITEFIPVSDLAYPSELAENENKDLSTIQKLDSIEYYKRRTNPHVVDFNTLCRWVSESDAFGNEKEFGHFEYVNDPSEDMKNRIKASLSEAESKQFETELQYLREISDNYKYGRSNSEEIEAWVTTQLS